jgi:FkbM family methyltransferase
MVPQTFKKFVRKKGAIVFGRIPRFHKIPFGPNKGLKIFISFDISPRMYFGIDEPWIATLAHQHLKPGDVVYDIGAHVGYTTILFRRSIGSSGFVHAFELLPSVATTFFQRTMEVNGFTNVVVHPIGLSNTQQTIALSPGDTMMGNLLGGASNGKDAELCKTTRLDEFITQRGLPIPSLMKIDIDGAEVDCLMGASNTLTRHHPILIVEFHSLDLLKKGYLLLSSYGYALSTRHFAVDDQLIDSFTSFHENVLCLPKRTL